MLQRSLPPFPIFDMPIKRTDITRDGKIAYDRKSIEVDATGVYLFFWRDDKRVAIKKLKDFLNEIDNPRGKNSNMHKDRSLLGAEES